MAALLSKLKTGLTKTRKTLFTNISNVITGKKEIDEEVLEQLEEILIAADVGVRTVMEILDKIREKTYVKKNADFEDVIGVIKNELVKSMGEEDIELNIKEHHPAIILVIGINGVGKTTTIGKLASKLVSQGKKVILAACDTFRAAAIDQLNIWAERNNIECVSHQPDSDPGAVVFDAITSAVAKDADVLIIDTAGRLHTKINLMEELKKIYRVIQRQLPEAPHETLLVLDATTGQNAIQQSKLFKQELGITGIVMAKMDGTAKGGIIFALKRELDIPIKFIGIGEQIEDLREFNSKNFIEAIFDK